MLGIYRYSMEIETNVKKLLLYQKEHQDRMDILESKENIIWIGGNLCQE